MIQLSKQYISTLKCDYFKYINESYRILLRGEFKISHITKHFENSINGNDIILNTFSEIIKLCDFKITITLYDECIIYEMINEMNGNCSNYSEDTFYDGIKLTIQYTNKNQLCESIFEINDQTYELIGTPEEQNIIVLNYYYKYMKNIEKYKYLLKDLDLKIYGDRDRFGIYVGYLTNEIIYYEMPHNNFNRRDFFILKKSSLDNCQEFIQFINNEHQ